MTRRRGGPGCGPGLGGGRDPVTITGAAVPPSAVVLLLLSAWLAWGAPAGALARSAAPPVPPQTPGAGVATGRDSLLQEIRRYRALVSVLSDSLAHDRAAGLSPEHRLVIERNISDISRVIDGIGSQLSQLEFRVKDNRISLVDGAGDGIVISVPDNLDEQVSRGLEALTAAILKELPDTARAGDDHLSWTSFLPQPPPPPRRIVAGSLVRVGQSVVVAADEEIAGDVVVILGNCEVLGGVRGDVVAVGGELTLRASAAVDGSVVAVGGRLTTEPGAKSGDTVAVGAFGGGAAPGAGLGRLLEHRTLTFAIGQGLFLLTLLAALLALAAAPEARRTVVLARLSADPVPAFGLGVLLVLGGPLVLAVLTGLLVITVIGVPVALLLVLGAALIVAVGLAAAGVVVGRRLGVPDRAVPLAALVGLCVLHVPSLAGSLLHLAGSPWPAVATVMGFGLLVKAAALACGLGALALSRLGARTAASDPRVGAGLRDFTR
ncbi:polymer-forming cytoskeletal protein [bacterium]|nr:polymer-forming cytoskeletal protein [bacterium]